MNDWTKLVTSDPEAALTEQLRIRVEFQASMSKGLIVGGFQKDENDPRYLLFENE
jgi:hypothetical protein